MLVAEARIKDPDNRVTYEVAEGDHGLRLVVAEI